MTAPLEHLLPFELADATLIRRVLSGDERAFRMLYDRHTPRLTMTVRRLLGPRREDADDVVQETWLSACRAMHTFRGDARFSTWLTSIAVRATLNHVGPRPRAETELEADVAAPGGAEPGAEIDLERALERLPDQQRMVVLLHDIEGFTHLEIGERLGVAPGTSKSMLSRARQTLRLVLSGGISNAR